MPSDVHIWRLRASMKAPYEAKIKRMLKALKIADHVRKGALTAIKMHFGEAGVTGHVQPVWIAPIVAFLNKAGARCFLTDTNTLYAGERGNAVDHHLLAGRHGYARPMVDAPVVIADGLFSNNEVEVPVGGKHLEAAYLAGDIVAADHLVTLNHFKGHPLAGIGGALKNAGMGCATRRGKMAQHRLMGPGIDPGACQGCGVCVETCGSDALSLDESGTVHLEAEACAGCGACFHACEHGALSIDWACDRTAFLERLMEYAAAVLLTRERPSLHISFVTQVTPMCDCIGHSDAPICPDIGLLASYDPVALDQACLDLVDAAPPLHPSALPGDIEAGQPKFQALFPESPADFGLEYAQDMGLGTRKYTLKEVE
jgi:uncharacterized Fe-S center protein